MNGMDGMEWEPGAATMWLMGGDYLITVRPLDEWHWEL